MKSLFSSLALKLIFLTQIIYGIIVITFTLLLGNLSQWSLPSVLRTLYEVMFA